MSQSEPSGPDLDGVVADANAAELPYVVIGGFSVIAHGYLHATKDLGSAGSGRPEADEAILRFLERTEATHLPDGRPVTREDVAGAHHLHVNSRHGIVHIDRGQPAREPAGAPREEGPQPDDPELRNWAERRVAAVPSGSPAPPWRKPR